MVQLNELLGGKSLLKVLNFFLRNPSKKISYTNVRNKVKIAKATLTKCLNFLLDKNFIKVEKIGVTKLYQLNKENLVIKQLKILDKILLLDKIKNLKKYNIKAYLYGSVARGEDTEESDIDLLIIGKIKKEQIFNDINKISKEIGREIKIQIFSDLDWSLMSRKDKPFYERVEKDKVRLI